jgi:hypothetical protein
LALQGDNKALLQAKLDNNIKEAFAKGDKTIINLFPTLIINY